MSDDAPPFGEQSEPQTVDTGNEGPSKGKGKINALQIEMINELDEIVTDFIAQKSSLHDACRYLTTTLDENPSLTAEQRAETYRMYGQ